MQLESLGDYTIVRHLGSGAFGQVYLAEQRFLKRTFVIKILPDSLYTDPVARRSFEEKVHAVAALDHPNIVKIHSVSLIDNRYFLVMDPFVDSLNESMNLDRYLDLMGPSLTEEDNALILEQVAAALDYAHENNLVHGGLKPTNILAIPSTNGIMIKLSDFSLNRLMGENGALSLLSEKLLAAFVCTSQSSVIHNRNVIRALSFLAPEQKLIDNRISEPSIDAYGFGILAYFLIARKVPELQFVPASQYFHDSKKKWDALISQCLAIEPKSRPTSLLKAVREFLFCDSLKESVSEMALSQASYSQELNNPKPILRKPEMVRPEIDNDPSEIFHRDMQISQYVPKKQEMQQVDPILTEMVIVPASSFFRGSNEGARDESPRHLVSLQSFAIDVHPVTNEQFVRFLQAMGGEKDSNNNDIIRLKDSRIKRNVGKLIIESGYGKHPVVGVTWYGAVAYAKWVGKRLPTEAEWEAAASSQNEEYLYPTGIEIDRTQANFFSSDTTPVMSYLPNLLNLYDMAGNVYEWCQDWYAYNYYETSQQEPENPQGPSQGVYRVLRGGCWKSLKEDMRCSHRHRNNPGAMNTTYGFRCATDVQ